MRRLTLLLPVILMGCIIGPGTYQVASTMPGTVAYCVAPGDPLENVAELARQHCAAQGQIAEMTLMETSATCSRGIYNLGGQQGQLVQYRCVAR